MTAPSDTAGPTFEPGDRPTTAGVPVARSAIRVVLVEDHTNVREQLTRLLNQAGIQVVAAAGTLSEGHHAILTLRPDVAVLDNHLPDGLGTDLCKRLRTERPQVATVIYSGHLTWEDDDRARRAGAAAVVPKSFSSHELLTAILEHAQAR